MTKKNLWILSEERPKREVIAQILNKFAKDNKITCFIDTIRILPILNKDRKFSFLYEVVGFHSNKIGKAFLKIVSGYSSFVDYLIFYQNKKPKKSDIPIYAIEETKTDDSESRNTSVFQRATKFVYIDYYFPDIKKIMLYNLKLSQEREPTDTYIFGTRCLLTLGVEIIGKKLNNNIFKPFTDIEDLIRFKNSMKAPPQGNIPILINKEGNTIQISGRLVKSNSLSHDPNIGALSLISATLRKLGWKGRIIVTNHGLKQYQVTPYNKFVKIANMLNIEIENIKLPKAIKDKEYWKYETKSEKLGTIFIDIVVENFTNGGVIFENHAGCERGYFITKEGEPIPVAKYYDRDAYKKGDKNKIISLPDLILIDFGRCEIINIEGKKYEFRRRAIKELRNLSEIEERYIKKYYPNHKIIRTVVLYGGNKREIFEAEIGFLLNKNGDLVLGIKPPELFKDAIKNLIDFWFS
jgi:hypothetical protein